MILTEANFKKYIPASLLSDFSLIEGQKDIALDTYLKPVLGADLITKLKAESPGEAIIALLPYVERPLAFFTYLDLVDTMDLVHTSAGFAVTSNPNMTPASKDRVAKFKAGMERNAYNGLEALLEFLEEKASDYPDWQKSDTYKDIQNHFIDSAKEFDTYVRIGRNRRTFLAMLPHIGDIEIFKIKSIVKDLFDALLDESATDEQKKLLPYIKGAVCNLAMGKALDILSLDITPDGIMLTYTLGVNKPSDESRIKARQRAYISEGEKYLGKLQEEYLLLFPETETSEPYQNDQSNIFVA